MTGASRGFSRAAAPVWGFSRGTMGSSGSLSCGAGEVRSSCAWRGGARHFSPVMVGESGLKTREEGLARFFSGYGRKPWVPSTYARDLRELFRVSLRSQGYCAVGRGRSELHWVWCSRRGPYLELRQEPQGSAPDFLEAGSDSDRRVPVEFAQECQVSCSAEEWNSAYISSCSRMTPLFVMCVEPAGFSEMHGGVSAPSCCAFIHRVAFEEVSGHRVLLKCGPGNWVLSACCTTHEATSRISS